MKRQVIQINPVSDDVRRRRDQRVSRFVAAAFAFVVLCVCVPRAVALDIIPTFDSSITGHSQANDIQTSIRAAIFEYKYRIADPLTVNILFKDDSSIGLGQSQAGATYLVNYPRLRAALAAHATTSLDSLAVASLPTFDFNPQNNGDMSLKPPLARALGLVTNVIPLDSTISLKTSECKLSPNDTWPASGYSMYAVVCHEIDEALGFGSALHPGQPAPTDTVTVEDLFRYGANNLLNFDTSASALAYFYIPGYGRVRQFNQDGSGDYGDWSDTGRRVQDANASPLFIYRLADEEMKVFDVIGYKILPTPVWYDSTEIAGGNGDYFWAYHTESDAGANVGSGGAIMIKNTPTMHHSRIDATTFGKPVKLTSFNGTTRIARIVP